MNKITSMFSQVEGTRHTLIGGVAVVAADSGERHGGGSTHTPSS